MRLDLPLLPAILLVMTPAAVLAHFGHGNEFEGDAGVSQTPTGGIEVDSKGQSVDAPGITLMKIQNQTRVGAIANLHEKDLQEVKIRQKVNIKVTSFPNRIFIRKIDYIATDVEG